MTQQNNNRFRIPMARGAFKTQLNIYDGVFFAKINYYLLIIAKVNNFFKKASS